MKRHIAAAMGVAALVVVAVIAAWFVGHGTRYAPGQGGPVITTVATSEYEQQERVAVEQRPLLPPAVGSPSAASAGPAASPGRLLAAPGTPVPPAGVTLALVACEQADPEGADVSLGGDGNGWQDIGDPVAAGGWTEEAWEWPGLAPGMWRLVARPESTHVLRGRSASPLAVHAGRTTSMQVELVPAGVLSVRLVRAKEDGVAAASVRVVGPLPPGCSEQTDWGDQAGTRIWRLSTDDDGRFTLSGLEQGQHYGVHGWSVEGDTVTEILEASRAVAETFTLKVTEPRHVRVRVVARSDGRALPGATLQVSDDHLNRLRGISRAKSPGRPLRDSGPTDEQGRVVVTAEPGAWLIAFCDGFDVAAVRVLPALVDDADLVIALDEPGDGRVHVVTEDGMPVARVRVEATVHSFANGHGQRQAAGQAISDSQGALRLSEFGLWAELRSGSLRLAAHDDIEGDGGLELDIGSLVTAQRGLARAVVLRRPGALEVDMATHGWPEPRLEPFPDRFDRLDVRERQDKEQQFTLTLWYLGSPGLRTEYSRHHGERRRLDPAGFAGGQSTARFDSLEPGDYCVELWSQSRGVSIVSPALRVASGETTSHWIAAPDATSHGRVTLVPSGLDRPEAGAVMTLLPADGFAFHGALPVLLSPDVALRDRRVALDATGRARFDLVPPGRWIIGTAAGAGTSGPQWRQTDPFLLGPGDDAVLTAVLEPAEPPAGLMY